MGKRNQPVVQIRFPLAVCQCCPVHDACTKGSQQGRTLNLNVQSAHQALQERRQEQATPEFVRRYRLRAGIEGTISQGVRSFGLRKTPYVGTAKTHLHHVVIATAINLQRIEAHLQAQASGKPTRTPRRRTPFAHLQRRQERCA